MDRFSEYAVFPLAAAALAAATGVIAAAIGLDAPLSTAIGVALFGAILALRNWSVGESDRPLLAEELTGLHERLEAVQADAGDLRELLTDLAAIVEEAAAREHEAMRSFARRLAELEGAREEEVDAAGAAVRQVREAMAPLTERMTQFDARTRKLALAIERGLSRAAPKAPEAATLTAPAAESAEDELRRLTAAADLETAQTSAGAHHALLLQAVFSAPEGEPRFFEAFTRRLGPNGEVAAAADHVDAAKADGSIGFVDNLLLARSVAAAEQFRAAGRDVAVFCNLSMLSLRDPGYLRALIGFLRKNAALARHLVFEFSQLEIEQIDDPDVAVLQKLRETGFAFSIDHLDDWSIDIANLAKIGFRFVKLEAGALLEREVKSPGAVARLARSFDRAGLSLIVEKVGGLEDARRLEAAGARFLQGEALAEPRLVSVDEPDFAALEAAARRALASGGPMKGDPSDGAAAAAGPVRARGSEGFDRTVLERAMQAIGHWPQPGLPASRRSD